MSIGPVDDTPSGWFDMGCNLATKGRHPEAERALKVAIDIRESFAIAWGILSAVLLAQGRETDAEVAGKKAIEQCTELDMTWPKLRTIMLSHGIKRGVDWKSLRRVIVETSDTTEWGIVLSKLSASSEEEIVVASEPEDHPVIELQPLPVDGEISQLVTIEEVDRNDIEPEEPETDFEEEPLDEKSEMPWFSIADVSLRVKDYEQAENAFIKGLAIDSDNGEAWLQVGKLLMRRHVYDEAEDALRKAIEHIPESSQAWLQLGICLQTDNRWEEAGKFLETAVEKNPRNAEAWMKLGENDFQRELYQDAARSFLRVLRMEPNHTDALFYLGRCMEYRGNHTHALRVYTKLLNLDPTDSLILEELSKSFHRLERPESARRAKKEAARMRRVSQDT